MEYMLPEPVKIAGFHSERSPSTAHRWRLCIGSVEEERGLPDEAGEEAIQGTVFHEFAADCLEIGVDPHHFVGCKMMCEDGDEREFTKEMATKMRAGLDLVWALADGDDAKLYVERRVNLERRIGDDESGTSDAFIIDVEKWRLVTFDWKWGAGVMVSPIENDQAILYTLGVWDTFALDPFREAYEGHAGPKPSWEEARDSIEVLIIIEQPRGSGGGGVWHTTMGHLLEEAVKIREDADATQVAGAPRVAGEKQCKFCKAARHNTCKTRSEYLTKMAGLKLDELADDLALGAEPDLPDRRALTPEQRSQILKAQKMITDWFKSLHEEAMSDSKAGRPVPGFKRVRGRNSSRSWNDEDKAKAVLENRLKEAAWNKKLLSPAQVEEEVGKAEYQRRYESFVATASAKDILVLETDRRESLASDYELLDEIDCIEPEDLI